jgi:hypothetical protein
MNLSKPRFSFVASLCGAAILSFFIIRSPICYSPILQKTSVDDRTLSDYRRSYPNLVDFENNYGTPLLGNKNITIISRADWQAPINYSRADYYARYCASHEDQCIDENQNDFESDLTYLKLKDNYEKNFKLMDDGLVKTKTINDNEYEYMPVNQIVIHHTAHVYSHTYSGSIDELNRIYYAHAVLNGWHDIGYNYLIDYAGNIFEGRDGGKYVVGSHTGYHNRGTIGIALMMNLTTESMTPKMEESLINLIKYLSQEYYLDLEKPDYLPSPDNSSLILDTKIIKGHNELDARGGKTQCPGIDPDTLRDIIYKGLGLKQPTL